MQLFYEMKRRGAACIGCTNNDSSGCMSGLVVYRTKAKEPKEELLKSCTCKKSRVFLTRHLSLLSEAETPSEDSKGGIYLFFNLLPS